MHDTTYLALSQYIQDSLYEDVVGEIYEFPNKYKGLMAKPNICFVYYEPQKRGSGTYFGWGRIGKTIEKSSPDDDDLQAARRLFLAEVRDYQKFARPVPLTREDHTSRETVLQNSVRKISRELFEEIVQLGGESVAFRADAHLMQVLGEQLIGSEQVGILELIKNAYDAGARLCIVRIDNVPGLPTTPPENGECGSRDQGPVITVTDDGCGMDRDTIIHGWLRPATTIKTRAKQQLKAEREKARQSGDLAEFERLVSSLKKEHGGRLPVGEKGVGRFATHRLGRQLLLRTKTMDDPLEWALEVDWDQFDDLGGAPKDLNRVGLALEHREPTCDYGPGDSGTVLRIYGGREGFEWTEEKLVDIGRAVTSLKSPSVQQATASFNASSSPLSRGVTSSQDSFTVEFDCPHIPEADYSNPLQRSIAPFSCDALVDEDGNATLQIFFRPPASLQIPMAEQSWEDTTLDLRAKNLDYWVDKDTRQIRRARSGPFYVHIDCWLRRKEWIHGADWRQVTEYLESFGGVGIYRDGLSVVPADHGAERDWLGLATAHIKKGSRISYYNMFGGVELFQEMTLDLVDKTSREGLLDTVPCRDLSELVRGVVEELEFRVKETRARYEKLKGPPAIDVRTAKSHGRIASKVLHTLAERYDFETDTVGLIPVIGKREPPGNILKGISGTIGGLRDNIAKLEGQIDGLTEAAGFGLSIGIAVHEIVKVAASLASTASGLSRSIPSDSPFKEQALTIRRVASSLLGEVKRISPLHVTRLEDKTTFGIREAILAAMGVFQMTWEQSTIHVDLPPRSDSFELQAQFGVCSQVFANLLDNATYWLSSITDDSPKRIMIIVDESARRVLVADTGPGIADRMRPHLFEPFYSLKSPPSGLGLYICKHYMNRLKGEIREARADERISECSGAQFILEFPAWEGTK